VGKTIRTSAEADGFFVVMYFEAVYERGIVVYVQLQLKFNVIGTSSASTLSTNSMSVHTARLSDSTAVIHCGPVTVRLPPHIVISRSPGSVGRASVSDVTDCYEAAVVLAKQSPYVYGLAEDAQVNS